MKVFGGNSGANRSGSHAAPSRSTGGSHVNRFENQPDPQQPRMQQPQQPARMQSQPPQRQQPVEQREPRRPQPQQQRAPKPPKKKGSAGKTVLIVLLVIALLVVGSIIFLKSYLKPPEKQEPVVDEQTGETDFTVEHYYTVLIVGEDQLGQNTDTLMVARLDTVNMKADIVSIPRDTIVNVERGTKRINAAYYDNEGGIEKLMDEVESMAGFRPNNYVMLDIQVFMSVVEALGGVEFDVPRDMKYADYAVYGDGSPYEFIIDVKKGLQTLNGYDALGVFRFRKNTDGTGYPGGDWQRIEVQHDLMMAIAQKAMSTRNIDTLMSIVNAVWANCKTDMSIANVGWFATQFLKMSMEDIHFHTAPTSGVWVRNTAYVQLMVDSWVEMINATINPYERQITKEDLSILHTVVDRALINGQHKAEADDFATTDGSQAYTNFAWGKS